MKEKKSLPVYISQASFGKEICAFAIDALFALVLGTVIRYTLGSYDIAPAAGYNEAKEAYYSLAEASGLYERNDGNLQLISYEGKGAELYNHYRDLNNTIWHYYFSAWLRKNDPRNLLPHMAGRENSGQADPYGQP